MCNAMLRQMSWVFLVLVLFAGGHPTGAVAEMLKQPVAINLAFLDAIKQNPDWLAKEIHDAALPGEWKLDQGNLVSGDLGILKFVNRIRAFSLMDTSFTLPFIELPLRDAAGHAGTCVTPFPRDIVPKLGARDFRVKAFDVASLDSPDVKKCLARDPLPSEYATLDRDEFRSRYFLPSGEIDANRFKDLDGDPSFVKAALDRGFYARRSDYSGHLEIT